MSAKLLTLARELRNLADRIESKARAGRSPVDELGELGALLLSSAAAISLELGFSRETFAGLARTSYTQALSGQARKPN